MTQQASSLSSKFTITHKDNPMLNTRIAITPVIAAFVFAIGSAAHAQSTTVPPAPTASASADLSEGEIRKVDKEGKKLTIKHGPLKSLDMPGMTMVFSVSDEAVLDKLQVGEKVRFRAEKLNDAITVTRIEAAR
ncbi:copper-binding protein [Variovorax rhizosphaerae]|uniref:Copper-binding protein n=2 Tax=Variovorax rhizosphaerae TaxID=1836200 RepID=A0ABU8WXZ3_9BURK